MGFPVTKAKARAVGPGRTFKLNSRMNLREQLLKEHSKANCERIVKWVGNDQLRFDELFRLFLTDDPIMAQRAAWPLSYYVIHHPELIKKHFARLIKN